MWRVIYLSYCFLLLCTSALSFGYASWMKAYSSTQRGVKNSVEISMKAYKNVPLVLDRSSSSAVALVDHFSKNWRCDYKWCESIEEALSIPYPSMPLLDTNTILQDKSREQRQKLQEANSIYLLEEMSSQSNVRDACKFDLYVSSMDKTSKRLGSLLQTLMQAGSGSNVDSNLEIDVGEWSHFVSLTFDSIEKAVPYLPALRIGADAFELRVDLLEDQTSTSLHRQIALLRDTCKLPIVFTVRSQGQIGKYPPDHKAIFKLLNEGLRAGCEWIDVEACWPQDDTESFCKLAKEQYAATSRLLGSLHVTTPQTEAQTRQLFVDSSLNGMADVLKVVTGAANDEDCRQIHKVGNSDQFKGKPYIGVCLSAAGAKSRVLNRRFTPVTHALMATAAPGQLTVEQLMKARVSEGLCVPKKFYLFGTPIQQSMSPAMHNGAYNTLSLPHVYSLSESEDVETYRTIIADKDFGGASVTIPHKESIIPLLDEVKGDALTIGAVNTIVVDRNTNKRVGYNTDWLGIKRPLLKHMNKLGLSNLTSEKGQKKVGLVVGAGGTAKAACYAIKDLGLDVIVTNRSPEKGQALAEAFGGRFVAMENLASEVDPALLQIVVSTLPAKAAYTLPNKLLEGTSGIHKNKPIILDVVYKPVRRALIEQAIAAECLFVQGATMLLEQGMAQFELWNQRRAPRDAMEAAVFNGIEKLTPPWL